MSTPGKIDASNVDYRNTPRSSGSNVYTNFVLSLAGGLTGRSREKLENVLNNAPLAHVVIPNGRKK